MATTKIPAEGYALLAAIANGETRGDYSLMYGDIPGKGSITDFSKKPKGTAGAYQFQDPAWAEEVKRLKLKDFSPESQDLAAWDYAQQIYARNTGQSLHAALVQGDLVSVASGLKGVWPSLPGGSQQIQNAAEFSSVYNSVYSNIDPVDPTNSAYQPPPAKTAGLRAIDAATGGVGGRSPLPAPAPLEIGNIPNPNIVHLPRPDPRFLPTPVSADPNSQDRVLLPYSGNGDPYGYTRPAPWTSPQRPAGVPTGLPGAVPSAAEAIAESAMRRHLGIPAPASINIPGSPGASLAGTGSVPRGTAPPSSIIERAPPYPNPNDRTPGFTSVPYTGRGDPYGQTKSPSPMFSWPTNPASSPTVRPVTTVPVTAPWSKPGVSGGTAGGATLNPAYVEWQKQMAAYEAAKNNSGYVPYTGYGDPAGLTLTPPPPEPAHYITRGGSNGASYTPPPPRTVTGVNTGNKYAIGSTVTNGNGSFTVNEDGSFTNQKTGATSVGSSRPSMAGTGMTPNMAAYEARQAAFYANVPRAL